MASESSSAGRVRDRYMLFLFSALNTFFFVGALFGWGPMQRMLESSGAFHSKCREISTLEGEGESGDEGVCGAQATTIVNVGFIAVCTNTLTPFIGQAIDHFSAAKVATYFMAPCAVIGAFLLVVGAFFSQSPGLNNLYYAAFCLLGLATYSGSLLSVQVGMYFQGTMQIRSIMLLNALFDAGSCTYLFLWAFEIFLHLDFFQVALIYFVLAFLLYSGAVYYWNVAVPEGQEVGTGEAETLVAKEKDLRVSVSESLRDFQAARMENSSEMQERLSIYRSSLSITQPVVLYDGTTEISDDSKKHGLNEAVPATDDGYILIAHRAPRDQLLSVPFVIVTLYFAINMISTNWACVTAADFLAAKGDDGTYLSVFTLLQPASVLALPVVDATVQKLGFGAAFQAVNLLCIIFILVKLFVDDLNVQIIHFVLVAVVRCYLFAVTFSFLPRLVSDNVVGKGTGILYLVGGIFSFVNIPLASFGGDFFIPNCFYLACTVPTVLMACYMDGVIKREDRVKAQLSATSK